LGLGSSTVCLRSKRLAGRAAHRGRPPSIGRGAPPTRRGAFGVENPETMSVPAWPRHFHMGRREGVPLTNSTAGRVCPAGGYPG
jgi:hypothetical protein